jgi:hypothetical protein
MKVSAGKNTSIPTAIAVSGAGLDTSRDTIPPPGPGRVRQAGRAACHHGARGQYEEPKAEPQAVAWRVVVAV